MTDLNKRILQASFKKKRRLPKIRPIPYPKAIERSYNADLQKIVQDLSAEIKRLILPILPSIARDLGQPTIKKDAGADDATKAIAEIKKKMAQKYTDVELKAIARKKGMSLAEYSRIATEKEFKRVAGVDLFLTDRALADTIEVFSIFNTQLSKSLIEESVNKVQSTILSGFQSGTRWEEIASSIEDYIDPEVGGIANRARLIARDQISKLNGQVTSERQKDLGIDKYRWRTSGDERVRDSHRELEGEIFSWDKPPSVGHPGEDFQCRCTAEPILDQFFEE